jgi:hypothetical protein
MRDNQRFALWPALGGRIETGSDRLAHQRLGACSMDVAQARIRYHFLHLS